MKPTKNIEHLPTRRHRALNRIHPFRTARAAEAERAVGEAAVARTRAADGFCVHRTEKSK